MCFNKKCKAQKHTWTQMHIWMTTHPLYTWAPESTSSSFEGVWSQHSWVNACTDCRAPIVCWGDSSSSLDRRAVWPMLLETWLDVDAWEVGSGSPWKISTNHAAAQPVSPSHWHFWPILSTMLTQPPNTNQWSAAIQSMNLPYAETLVLAAQIAVDHVHSTTTRMKVHANILLQISN